MKQKNYLIFGLGKSGKASFNLLYNKKDSFYLYDENSILRKEMLENTLNLRNVFVVNDVDKIVIGFVDIIILSPGVSINLPILKYAKRLSKEIISELELGFRHCKNKIIAITGTNGKTTTVSLLYEIFKTAGFQVEKVGNIGCPLCDKVKNVNRKTIFICEVSSFQLEAIKKFKPFTAGILNIDIDHLNRHKTFNIYKNTKLKIFKNMKNAKIVLNKELSYKNHKLKIYKFGFSRVKNGCFCKNNEIFYSKKAKIKKVCNVNETSLKGNHNLENIMACICFAKMFKIKNKYIIKALNNFKNISHRIEKVYQIDNKEFYDDSKATNVHSCLKAIQTMTRPTILILGGSDKGYFFDEIFKNLSSNIIEVLACGQIANKVKQSAKRNQEEVRVFKNLKEATIYACSKLENGQNLLLSPASASFDEFNSYKERGEKFLSYIKEYYEKNTFN